MSVDRNGNIFELRTTELAGDTDTKYDTTGHFLVVCEGDFEQEVVTEAQLHGTAVVFAWAAQTFGIASNTLAGHKDVAPGQTSCPGANLYCPSHLGRPQGPYRRADSGRHREPAAPLRGRSRDYGRSHRGWPVAGCVIQSGM